MMDLHDFYVVVVSGTRNEEDAIKMLTSLRRKLSALKKRHGTKLLVISGEATGIDYWARKICDKYGIWFVGVPAPWNRFHNGAGPKRNTFMLEIFEPQLVIACHPDLKNSKGTKNCVEQAEERKVKVHKISK